MSAAPARTAGTPHGSSGALGPLGRRLLAAFVLVALAAVALVAGAGLVGSSLGLSRSTAASRAAVADRVAADGYRAAGEWATADLTPAVTTAAAAGARVVVLDADGRTVTTTGRGAGMGQGLGQGLGTGSGMGSGSGSGMGSGMGMTPGAATSGAVQATAPVTVDGARVGTVVLGFPAADATGRRVAWSWILAAAVAALLVAALAARYVVRSTTRPLVALTEATRAFGAGDTSARPAERGVGELAELADAFEQAADAVQTEQRIRRAMTADVAHELRTPLSALQAGLEELRDGLVVADRERLSRLHDQALRLSRTVQELSRLSAADAAAYDLHRADTDLGAATAEVVAERAAQLRTAGVEVDTDLPGGLTVRLDTDRWHEIVGNLLDNCARHCRPGDRVRVRVAPVGAGARPAARLEVADTGPGIAAEDLPHVFERFRRGRDRHGVAGSGIGLAVVARLVEAHGGTVRIDSVRADPDGTSGTVVTVDLPTVALSSGASSGPTGGSSSVASGPTGSSVVGQSRRSTTSASTA